jgi:hypothetical protein
MQRCGAEGQGMLLSELALLDACNYLSPLASKRLFHHLSGRFGQDTWGQQDLNSTAPTVW